jgi:hypothetical protein
MGFYLRAGLSNTTDGKLRGSPQTGWTKLLSSNFASGLRSEYSNHSWLTLAGSSCNKTVAATAYQKGGHTMCGLGTRCNGWVANEIFCPSLSSLRSTFLMWMQLDSDYSLSVVLEPEGFRFVCRRWETSLLLGGTFWLGRWWKSLPLHSQFPL